MAVIQFPSDEEAERHFEAYCLALGKVAHAWNYLFERLGGLFVIVAGGNAHVSNAIWYAPDSDRTKLAMLKEATNCPAQGFCYLPERPAVKEDIIWLINRTVEHIDKRNSVIHAPCVLRSDADGTSMAASFNGHNLAKKLWGKEILVEFDWCERWAEELSRFAQAMENALHDPKKPWPGRPGKPDQRRKKDLLPQLPPESTKQRPPPPQSSEA